MLLKSALGGELKVAVTLKKSSVGPETTPARATTPSPALQKEAERDSPQDRLRKKIHELSSESKYCDVQVFHDLIRFAIEDCGMDEINARAAIEVELERNCVLNEVKKIEELYSLLRRFTQNDKKLDPKEHEDALQKVSTKKPGYSRSLKPEVAIAHLNKFCRDNEVKIKTGLFKWEIP